MNYHEMIQFLTKTTVEIEVILIVWVPFLSLTKGPFSTSGSLEITKEYY